jgi:flagellar basal body P-ring protein FlgI
MPLAHRWQVLALAAFGAALCLTAAGADGKRSASLAAKARASKKEAPLKAEETIGDLAFVRTAGDIRVEGIGLVVGLNGTGSDPRPGLFRKKLLDGMHAAMVPQSERILTSKNVSLVLIRGNIPPGITRDDHFDVAVELEPDSNTQSLSGGVLLRTELKQIGAVDGKQLEGKILGYAGGPVVTGTTTEPDNVKSGRILGGARVRNDVPYSMIIKDDRKSVRTAALIQAVISMRFFALEGIDQKGMADAKNDQYLVLKVPKVYHQNQARFFQVVQLLPLVDNTELRAQRLDRWEKELLDPKTSGVAALRLEGVGKNATSVLKKGVDSPDPNVRFFAAEALAYLGDGSGVDVLAKTAIERPQYRAFALAALAASDQAPAIARLRELLSYPAVDIRYGAFTALRTLDPNDAFLGKVPILREEGPDPTDDMATDSMAMQIAVLRARRDRPIDPFTLYVVDCEGPPLIHVSNSGRCEIVVFGRDQKLLTPVVLGDPSSVVINASVDDLELQITRIAPGQGDLPDRHVSSPPEVARVVQEVANLGASYPQIVDLLKAAERQKNLEGPLHVDAQPSVTTDYDRAQLAGDTSPAKKDDALKQAGGEKAARKKGLLDRLRFWDQKTK